MTIHVIDGKKVSDYRAVHAIAVKFGFNGTRSATIGRLRRGANTWAELSSPVDAVKSASRSKTEVRRAADRAEMAAICAALDARRAAIA